MAQLLEDRTGIKARTPMPTHDVTNATSIKQVTAESVSFSDGAAGTTQRLKLTYDGVMSLYGERIGQDGDSSLSFTTGTVLTTEVPWRFKNTEGKDTETDRLATMASGDFMVDYENGYILGKNAISTSTSTDTVSYKVRLQATNVITGDITVDSEFPTAAALGDATANPTTTSVASMSMGYNGTTWDRVRVTTTGKILNSSEYAEDTVFADASYVTLAGL